MDQTKSNKIEILTKYFVKTVEEYCNDIADLELREKGNKVIGTDSSGREYDIVVEWNLNPHDIED